MLIGKPYGHAAWKQNSFSIHLTLDSPALFCISTRGFGIWLSLEVPFRALRVSHEHELQSFKVPDLHREPSATIRPALSLWVSPHPGPHISNDTWYQAAAAARSEESMATASPPPQFQPH